MGGNLGDGAGLGPDVTQRAIRSSFCSWADVLNGMKVFPSLKLRVYKSRLFEILPNKGSRWLHRTNYHRRCANLFADIQRSYRGEYDSRRGIGVPSLPW